MAKELFEVRSLSGKINVTLKDFPKKGKVSKWNTDKSDIIRKVVATVDEFYQLGYKLTLRQLYYQLVSKEYIPNHEKVYKRLSEIINDCRYAGVIDWNMIEDRGRVPYLQYYNDDPNDALRDTIKNYKVDRMIGQQVYIEVWTEKDAISAILSRVTDKYHVVLVVNKGYTSSSAMYGAYNRFLEQFRQGKSVHVMYFGDHDPSGLDMLRDIEERLRVMINNGDNEFSDSQEEYTLEVIPVGLTMAQIKKYTPPPNPAKHTDSRSPWYIKQFGEMSWEVDALSPAVIVKIVEDNVKRLIDEDQYNEMLNVEAAGVKTLTRLVAKLKDIEDEEDEEDTTE